MSFCRSWRPKTLLVVGVTLYTVMVLRPLSAPIWRNRPHDARVHISAGSIVGSADSLVKQRIEIAETIQKARASWIGAYQVNTHTYLHQLGGVLWQVPATLGLMMIGLSLFKTGFLAGRSSTRRYKIVMVAGVAALVSVCWLLWKKDVRSAPCPDEKALELLLAPLVSLLYASGLIMLLRAGGQRYLFPLASAGRIAFTNYLTQSVIMTSIFYGGRGALMGEVNRVALWGIVVAVWVLQLIWSPLWLSRFEMGPFEWTWRCMTYGKKIPFLKPTARCSYSNHSL